MEEKRFSFSLKHQLRPKNKNNDLRDPTNDFSLIPSWNKEFVCLLGLEEVVQFRLEWQDKIVSTVPNKHRTRGRKKKFPIPSVVPATLPKDPYTCVKCSTDVSCSWNRDVNCSILCHTCFKCSSRKDHRISSGPKETMIKSISDKSSILTSSSQAVCNEPQIIKEDVFPLLNPSRLFPEKSDQQVLKNSLLSSSSFHLDSPLHYPSPYSLDLSSSPPGFYSDTSSLWSSSCSSAHYSSSSSSSSDLNYSSSSMTPSPPCSPAKNPSKQVSKKIKKPYWMVTPLAKALLKDTQTEQDVKKMKDEQLTWNKSLCQEEKTEKIAVLDVPPWLNELKFQTRMSKTTAERNKLTVKESLKPGHGHLQKVTPNVSGGNVSSKNTGSSTYISDSGKSTACYLPKSCSPVFQQKDMKSVPQCYDESVLKNKKFGTKVQPQVSHAHHFSSRTSSPSTHLSILSQSALSTNQEKTKPEGKLKWNTAPNQKIDKWIQKPKPSMGTHGSYASHSSSSFGQSRNVNHQVVVSPKREICSTKVRSTHK